MVEMRRVHDQQPIKTFRPDRPNEALASGEIRSSCSARFIGAPILWQSVSFALTIVDLRGR
jgi:hypothetical protein